MLSQGTIAVVIIIELLELFSKTSVLTLTVSRSWECLVHFRLKKPDIYRLVNVMTWPHYKNKTRHGRNLVTQILNICIMFRRLASPCRRADIEKNFGKHTSQLSTIFWEVIERLLDTKLYLFTSAIYRNFMSTRLKEYSKKVHG